MFIATLFIIIKVWEQRKCPSTGEWMKKTWCVCVCVCARARTLRGGVYISLYIHIYNGCCSAIKKNEILSLVATWMDLEYVVLTKISQTEKVKCMISLLGGI